MFQHQDVRGKAHDIFEVVGHEDQRHLQRTAQAVDLSSEDVCERNDRRQRTARRAAAPPALVPALLRARRAAVRRRTTRVAVSNRVQQGGRDPAAPWPGRVVPLADDARVRSSRCQEPSDVETSAYSWKTNPTARRCGGQNTPASVSVHVSPPDCTRACAGRARPAIERRIVVLPLPDGPKIASTCTRVAGELDVEGNRTLLTKGHGEAVVRHDVVPPVATTSSWPSASRPRRRAASPP